MNKQLVRTIITDKVSEKLSQLMEELSTYDFVDSVTDEYSNTTKVSLDDDQVEEITEMISDKVFPLMTTIQTYVIENLLVKN